MALTERDVLNLLHRRYLRTGPAGQVRYVTAEHVRSDAGYHARRTADLIAIDLWPSAKNALIGHEVKVSRSDWLAELRDPTKSLPFRRYCTFWYLVAPAGVAKVSELPPGWGLMVVGENSLRVSKKAPQGAPKPLSPSFTASLASSVSKTSARLTRRQFIGEDGAKVPCQHCREDIVFTEDGRFRHVEGNRRACTFSENDWKYRYQKRNPVYFASA